MRGLMLLGTAVLGLAAPATAGTIVTYLGHITKTFDQQGHDFRPSTGKFVSRSSYADDQSLEWASLRIDGLPYWRFDCIDELPESGGPCRPLVLSSAEISSNNSWSIEDVSEVSVRPYSPFSSLPWPDGKFVYRVEPQDQSFAFVGVSDLFGDCGFCYYMGTGVVDRVTFGFGVPEPANWGLMLAGFGLLGVSIRRQQRGLA